MSIIKGENITLEELKASNARQTKIYKKLFQIGKSFNETLEIADIYQTATDFVQNELHFQKCLIFEHDDKNGWFKIVKSIGYDNPIEQKILKVINLLLSGEVIEYLRLNNHPIMHTQQNPNEVVEKLVKSLFLTEAYFELFGGDIEIPFGLIVVGNDSSNLENFSRISTDSMVLLALGNFITQFSNTLNNIIFYKAWNDEKQSLEKNIDIRTQEIKAQKDTFEAIFKTSKDGIAILDAETSAFLDVNKAFEEITGFSRVELLRTSCIKLTSTEDKEKSFSAIAEVIEKGYIKDFVKSCTLKDDKKIITSMSMSLMSDKKTILTSVRDITTEKQLEANLLESKIKAEEATKAKSEFLANMSHEIRTPMNGIIGMSHLALQTQLDDKQRNYIQKIDNSAKSLLGIINDILDFSKIEAGKLTIDKINFDLFKLIDSIVNLVELKVHEKNLEMIVSYAPNINKHFFGDNLRISQILTNLVSNAVKFTSNGEVGIYIEKTSSDRIRFSVKDTGIGLSEAEMKKLFQSFSQADGSTTRKYGGTGLGLTISKQLVELMNGKIWVESEKGKGSNFLFEIELPSVEEKQKSYNQFKDKRVLIVDDNETWHEILQSLLENFGLNVDVAHDGYSAIEILNSCKNKYDLILMDWNMPKLDGIETTKLLNGNCSFEKPPTVIMVSAFRQESIIKLAKEVGIDIFLQKPINPTILNDILSGLFLDTISGTYTQVQESKTLKSEIGVLKSSNILLVEDNSTNQEIILGLLEGSGIDIDIANNGQEAVDMFTKNQTKYDLILMDLQMPIMDGYEATKQIRKLNQDIPIIALTANAMKEDIERTKEASMNEHLNKPIEVEKLYSTLLKYISKKTDNIELVIDSIEDTKIPNFINIDIKIGLSHMANNKKLYLKILNDFYNNYNDLNLESLENEELIRVAHTIKGLSANIGAKELSDIASKLETTQDKKLYPKFYEELNKVLDELKDLKIEKKAIEKQEISKELRDELLINLKQFASKRRAKQCNEICDELNKYQLSSKDDELVREVEELLKQRKYKEIGEMI